ncbi:MAG TPA: glycosyltransferase family 2 protein [Chitinophagaceae bacterium]|nr:glycosyltransferase family 2 protein [Chitinophagaceae bacterium]
MIRLSVVIISFNAQKHIGKCLDSVQGIADDIVVLDCFSTDSTFEICRVRGARVIQHPFLGYSAQKNLGLSFAQFPHILSLDADEWLSPGLRDSIGRVKLAWDRDGYWVDRLNFYCGKWIRHGSWYPDRKLRIFDSRKGYWGGTYVHERFILSSGGKTGKLKGKLMHQAYHSIPEHLEKMGRYSRLSAQSMRARGRKASWFRLFFSPKVAFLKSYLVKLGFLDGWRGLVIASMIAYGTLLKYALLRDGDCPATGNGASSPP